MFDKVFAEAGKSNEAYIEQVLEIKESEPEDSMNLFSSLNCQG